MPETVIVANRCPTAIRISGPRDFGGENSGAVVLHGARHPSAAADVGLTYDVDAALFQRWISDNTAHPAVLAGLLYEVSEEEAAQIAPFSDDLFGFEASVPPSMASPADVVPEGREQDPTPDTEDA